jgi:hypothetical protein
MAEPFDEASRKRILKASGSKDAFIERGQRRSLISSCAASVRNLLQVVSSGLPASGSIRPLASASPVAGGKSVFMATSSRRGSRACFKQILDPWPIFRMIFLKKYVF